MGKTICKHHRLVMIGISPLKLLRIIENILRIELDAPSFTFSENAFCPLLHREQNWSNTTLSTVENPIITVFIQIGDVGIAFYTQRILN